MKKNRPDSTADTKTDIKDPIKFTGGSFEKMTKSLLVVLFLGGCLSSEMPAEGPGCRVSGAFDRILDNLAGNASLELSDGVRFVKVNDSVKDDRGRSVGDSVLTRVKRFFADYELQVKLSDIFSRKQDMIDTLRKALTSLNELQGGNDESSRGNGNSGFGGGKKGGGAILMMATMMGGTMAALGFGALGMLVMKALTVSAMALLLSAVIGLRRLIRRPDDDAGFGRISYIPVHTEHRKRRSFQDLPYRAYVK